MKLHPWQEAMGRVLRINNGVVALEGVGEVDVSDSCDGILEEKIQGLLGQKVAILRTDVPDREYLLREVKRENAQVAKETK